jgi:Ni/Fe-hydrogenase subunit HybB-like protein
VNPVRRLSIGRIILWALVLGGMVIAAIRYIDGLGAVTHLSDRFPWGLWVGFDIMCGVALAAGGFTMAAAVHILHLKAYQPLLRPAIVTGFLGYVLVIVALLVDLGRPYRIWHAIIMWNPHSVMFEVAWCVMLYTSVLALEFGQVVLDRLGRTVLLRITHLALPPLVIAGVILSTLHQSSLGSLFLIVPGKLHHLWYSPFLPLFFFVSAVAVGMAIVIVESCVSARAYGRSLELPLLAGVGRILRATLAVLLVLRLADLAWRGELSLAFVPSTEAILFDIEVGAGIIVPLILLGLPPGRRSARGLASAGGLVVFGVVLNRLNVAITGMMAGSHTLYVPSWMEVEITLAMAAAGVLAYQWIVEHLPVFQEADQPRTISLARVVTEDKTSWTGPDRPSPIVTVGVRSTASTWISSGRSTPAASPSESASPYPR